jgi:hypothetical protein
MRLRRAPRRLLVAQKINRRVKERDAMLDAHLHSLGGHCPQFERGGELDLAQRHVQDLARPRRAQGYERERLCRCASVVLSLPEGGNVGVGHGRVVAAHEPPRLGRRWSKWPRHHAGLARFSPIWPRVRVRAASITVSIRPLRAEAVAGARVHRLQRPQHGLGVDLIDPQIADRRAIGRERHLQLGDTYRFSTTARARRCSRRRLARRRGPWSGPPCQRASPHA